MTNDETIDLLIAGQGAAAFAAGLYAARYRLDVAMAGAYFGGETGTAGTIENYPGVPSINGLDLMLRFKEQVDGHEVPILESEVTGVSKTEAGWRAVLDDGDEVHARALILAVGRERRKLNLPHEDEWSGRGVSYCSTCDAPLYRDKTIAVVGGGDSAVEGALLGAKHARQVYLLYRGAELHRPQPVSLEQLEDQENLELRLSTEVSELLGTDQAGLNGIRITGPSGTSEELAIDGLFIEIGADPKVELATNIGVELNPTTNEIHVDRMARTNVPGVFAAGDVTDASGALKQTVTAASQGAVAAYSAYNYVSEVRSRRALSSGG